jgi:hypothetical protein
MDFDAVFLIDSGIEEEGLYVYYMRNIVEKHIKLSAENVRSRGGSLVYNNFGKIWVFWRIFLFTRLIPPLLPTHCVSCVARINSGIPPIDN